MSFIGISGEGGKRKVGRRALLTSNSDRKADHISGGKKKGGLSSQLRRERKNISIGYREVRKAKKVAP